jgi:hypothetical protein
VLPERLQLLCSHENLQHGCLLLGHSLYNFGCSDQHRGADPCVSLVRAIRSMHL